MPPKSIKKEVVIVAGPGPKKSAKKKSAHVVTTIKGRGDYRPTSFTRIRGRGDYLGDLLGGVGSKLGNAAQGMFRDITGFGTYRTHGPKLNSISQMVSRAADTSAQNLGTAGPSENPFVMGAMSVKFAGKAPRIQHREFISDVVVPSSGSSFHTTAYSIQPGLSGPSSLFPWGSSVFGNFENYIMHGLVLEYVTTSSNFSSSSALGSVSMSTVYDAEASPLANIKAVNNNEFTTSAPPSSSFYHPVECNPKVGATNVKYIRKSNGASGADSRFDDVGLFQISFDGLSAPPGTVIGQLWASYDIEVLKAVLPDLHLGTTAAWDFALSAGITDLFLLPTPNGANSLPATVQPSPTGNTLTVQMPEGYNGSFMVVLAVALADGQSAVGLNVGLNSSGSDLTDLLLFPTGFGTHESSQFTLSSANNAVYLYAFSTIAESTADNHFQLFSSATSTTGGARSSLAILPLDNDVSDSSSFLSKLLKGNPRLAQVAALLASHPEVSTRYGFVGPNGARPPPPTLYPQRKPLTIAVESPTYVGPASAAPPVHPRVAGARCQAQTALVDIEDLWVNLPRNSLAPGNAEPPTPPNTSGASPVQTIAQAEQALAVAIQAAALRARSTLTYLATSEGE
jgi:hypothetical protein